MVKRVVAAALIVAFMATPSVSFAQSSATPATAGQTQPTQPGQSASQTGTVMGGPEITITANALEQVRRALNTVQVTKKDDRLRFYVEIIAKQPNFAEIIAGQDLRNGPIRGAGMTHSEFVSMVTPKEIYSSAGIGATDLLQGALFNWAAGMAIKKIKEMHDARQDAQIQAIRDRIDRELAALRGGG